MTRWTDENKATLLRLIFETQNFQIDLDKIVDAWRNLITNHTDPTAGDDKPTGKALSEQLGKYRKPGSSITFRFTKAKRAAPGGSGSSAPNTPTPKKIRKTNEKTSKVKAEVPSSPAPVPKIKGESVEDDKKFPEA
ncbi:similar to An01g05460 [Aspergillus luchuensis]|uniref:Similar to An01g05460 n=1 Tax=Aspergillus kawachii TaxID=1069201 RepID=A0A146FN84_ASPKA|nr:similar to An01g05460 [Aspergillus luchuensis]